MYQMDMVDTAAALQTQAARLDVGGEAITRLEGPHGPYAVHLTRTAGPWCVLGVELEHQNIHTLFSAARALKTGFHAHGAAGGYFGLLDDNGMMRCCRRLNVEGLTEKALANALTETLSPIEWVCPPATSQSGVPVFHAMQATPRKAMIGPVDCTIGIDTAQGSTVCELQLCDLSTLAEASARRICEAALRLNFFTLYDGKPPLRLNDLHQLCMSGLHGQHTGQDLQSWLDGLLEHARQLNLLFGALAPETHAT